MFLAVFGDAIQHHIDSGDSGELLFSFHWNQYRLTIGMFVNRVNVKASDHATKLNRLRFYRTLYQPSYDTQTPAGFIINRLIALLEPSRPQKKTENDALFPIKAEGFGPEYHTSNLFVSS